MSIDFEEQQTMVVNYIWLDGSQPTSKLRYKTRVIEYLEEPSIENFPIWNFDGSSTNQSEGGDSDLILKPVNCFLNTIDGDGYLVLCEVYNHDDTPHDTNERAKLRNLLDKGGAKYEPWIGFEQEYVMFKGNTPLGWPKYGFPAPQGPYYCGVGTKQIYGRELAEQHREACLAADLMYYGMNAEVMPAQWEFQMGYRGIKSEDGNVLKISDQTWIARWILHRLSEEYNIHISLENKPVSGDWNGSGMHSNFSTNEMRDKNKGMIIIEDAIKKLQKEHNKHIPHYGDKLEERLTGEHETAHISAFSAGIANRTASIRIPRTVQDRGYGYIEDRRPGANADPYVISQLLISTICEIKE